ncbi:MAG TPA: hypothetical protein PK431_16885 [Chitinophagales bacterium]|nr:hypothetical protein [Chitinophagales bacterium]
MKIVTDIMDEDFEMPDSVEDLKAIIEKNREIYKAMIRGADKKAFRDKLDELIQELDERLNNSFAEYL